MLTVWSFSYGFGSGRLLGLTWDLPGLSCGPLGGSWRLLWGPLATCLDYLGASWWLLGRLWDLVGASWWLLVSPWECLGACLAYLGASWCLLGSRWDSVWGLLLVWRLLGSLLGLAWPIMWASWGIGVGGAFRCGAGSCRLVTLLGVLGWGWEIAVAVGQARAGRLHSF